MTQMVGKYVEYLGRLEISGDQARDIQLDVLLRGFYLPEGCVYQTTVLQISDFAVNKLTELEDYNAYVAVPAYGEFSVDSRTFINYRKNV